MPLVKGDNCVEPVIWSPVAVTFLGLVKHGRKEGRKCFIQPRTQYILFRVIWHRTYGNGYRGISFRLAARGILYAPSHRQDITYHGLCYTSRGALAGTRNIMSPP